MTNATGTTQPTTDTADLRRRLTGAEPTGIFAARYAEAVEREQVRKTQAA